MSDLYALVVFPRVLKDAFVDGPFVTCGVVDVTCSSQPGIFCDGLSFLIKGFEGVKDGYVERYSGVVNEITSCVIAVTGIVTAPFLLAGDWDCAN